MKKLKAIGQVLSKEELRKLAGGNDDVGCLRGSNCTLYVSEYGMTISGYCGNYTCDWGVTCLCVTTWGCYRTSSGSYGCNPGGYGG